MIERSVEDILQEYTSLGINQQIDFDKFYLYSMITHSTAIEGSTITEEENKVLFEEGIGTNKPIKEQLMNIDLKNAYEKCFEYAENHELITIKLLCNLSGILMKNTGSVFKTITGDFSAANGDLRLVNVSAGKGGKSYLAWQKVPQKLEDFCNWINNKRLDFDKMSLAEKYKFSFECHLKLVSIHPWADGNGRMSRLVMNMIQYEAGIIPSIVKKEKRLDYIHALSTSQETEDASIFIDFMMEHHKSNLLQQINEYKKSINKDVDIQNNNTNSLSYIVFGEQYVSSVLKYAESMSLKDAIDKTEALLIKGNDSEKLIRKQLLKNYLKINDINSNKEFEAYIRGIQKANLVKEKSKSISSKDDDTHPGI